MHLDEQARPNDFVSVCVGGVGDFVRSYVCVVGNGVDREKGKITTAREKYNKDVIKGLEKGRDKVNEKSNIYREKNKERDRDRQSHRQRERESKEKEEEEKGENEKGKPKKKKKKKSKI